MTNLKGYMDFVGGGLPLIFALLLSGNVDALSFNKSRGEVYDMSSIDLVGMKIIDSELKSDVFGYKIKVMMDIEEVEDMLGQELAPEQEIVSRVFELNQTSSFANIYVFVAADRSQEKLKYVLYTVFKNKRGSVFSVDYDVVHVTSDYLDLENGPSDSLSKLRLSTGRPLFGHDGRVGRGSAKN